MAANSIRSAANGQAAEESKTRRAALAGNPNCGKTTIFNALTGLRYKVANYPGVTVEKKSGTLNINSDMRVELTDLPGIYSFAGNSYDEKIASEALLGQIEGESKPELVVCVIDAANLERNLYLATQLIDLGMPLILALNMMDVAEERGISIKKEILSRLLDVPVLSLVGSKKEGIEQLRLEIGSMLAKPSLSSRALAWVGTEEAPLIASAREIGAAAADSKVLSPEEQTVLGLELLSDSRGTADSSPLIKEIESAREGLLASGIDASSREATARYKYINDIVRKTVFVDSSNRKFVSDKIDAIVTHKIWGSAIFLLIMATIFQVIFLWAKAPMDLINNSFASLGDYIGSLLPQGKLKSLVVDGIIAGVGSVVVFIPQIGLLFFFLSLLEDSGYLSRAAFLMDRVMRKVGLQGRSFIPLLSSFACAIPGIMSTRTIPSFADRLTTILIAPLMSCSARLPVYTLLIAACIPSSYIFGFVSLQGITLLSMYLLGVAGAAIVAWILKLSILRGEPALFVMEMPVLRLPSPILAVRESLDRILLFLKSAGTMILACSVILWALAATPRTALKRVTPAK